jgi:hypothetical protein
MEIAKDLFKRFAPYIAGLLLIVTVFFLFNQSKDIELKNIKLKSELETSKNLANFYFTEYKNTKLQITELSATIDNLKKQSIEKEKEILIIKNKYNEKIKSVNKFTVSDMQFFWNNRYGTRKNGYSRFDTVK